MLACLRHIVPGHAHVKSGQWSQLVGSQLSHKTVGIIGCGHIGKDLTHLLKSFQCQLLAYDIRNYSEFYQTNGVIATSLDQLIEESDIVTLHVPYTTLTHHIINASRIERMKKGAILINTARGNLVDEQALFFALKDKQLTAAAFDVFSLEPPLDKIHQELLQLSNFVTTPHVGGSSLEAILAMGRAAIEGLENPKQAREFLENSWK